MTETHHMLKKCNVRRGCSVPNPLTFPSTKNTDGTKTLAMTGSVDSCSVLSETLFVGTCLRVDTTRVLYVGGFIPLWELPEIGQSLTSYRL